MKKSNSICLLDNINYRNKNDIKFESMKDIFHNPSSRIISKHLLNSFTSNISISLVKQKKSEYSCSINQKKKKISNLLNQFIQKEKTKITPVNNNKITDSDCSSYYHNGKLGLNSPLSYNELSKNSSYINDQNNNSKVTNININKSYNNNNIKKFINLKNIILNKNDEYKTILKKEKKKNKISPYNSFNLNSYTDIMKNRIKIKSNSNSKTKLKSLNKSRIMKNNKKNKNNNKNIEKIKNNIINDKIVVIYDLNNKNNRYAKIQKKIKMNNLINNNYHFYDRNNGLKTNTNKSNNIKNDIFKNILKSLNTEKKFKNQKIRSDTNDFNNSFVYQKKTKQKKSKNKSMLYKIQNIDEIFFTNDNNSLDLNIDCATTTNKSKQINSTYFLTKKFITNKNNHFNYNL